MIKITEMPAVRDLLARAAVEHVVQTNSTAIPVEYVRAPVAPGPQQTGARPPAVPRSAR